MIQAERYQRGMIDAWGRCRDCGQRVNTTGGCPFCQQIQYWIPTFTEPVSADDIIAILLGPLHVIKDKP